MGAQNFSVPRPGTKSATAFVWWLFGLYALFYAKAPHTPSLEAEQRYADLMQQAVFSEEGLGAQRSFRHAQRDLDQVHVWGWRWREPYSRMVPVRKAELARAQHRLNEAVRERDALESQAKAQVGIWSEYGVKEVRGVFWDSYQWGKDYAKRMTWWDLILGVGGGRDEELYVVIFRWIAQIMMNITVGLVAALISFAFSLFSLIWTYKTSLVSGILFFAVAISGASAMVAAVIGGMTATVVGGVYVVGKSAANARLEGGRRGTRRPAHVRYEERGPRYSYEAPHVD